VQAQSALHSGNQMLHDWNPHLDTPDLSSPRLRQGANFVD